MAHWIVYEGGYYKCSNCKALWDDYFYGVSSLDKCPTCNAAIDKSKQVRAYEERDYDERNEDILEDAMIRASRKAGLTKDELIDIFYRGADSENGGLMGVYNLGMKHMYEYLEGVK